MSTKYQLWLHLKNALGSAPKSLRKIVIFLVDDYGNVRLDSKKSRDQLIDLGHIDGSNRFDLYDTLETREDLQQLLEVLHSVKDNHRHSAVFTPMAMSANPDFEKIEQSGWDQYYFETVKSSFERKEAENPDAYRGGWEMILEGIAEGIFAPQFHGREHLNVGEFNRLVQNRSEKLKDAIECCSLPGGYYTGQEKRLLVAFDSYGSDEYTSYRKIIQDGVDLFSNMYGYPPGLFTAPGDYPSDILEETIFQSGLLGLDTIFMKKGRSGIPQFRRLGQRNDHGSYYVLRNAVFEPTSQSDPETEVEKTLNEIAIAFQWNKPAIISSHRVNFCGHIDPKNRERGLSALKSLLRKIVAKWPEVEFISGGELVKRIARGNV